ncbi:hypothetical protein KY366_01840 [Candidatus Woesearchaeota archaeon]|nr:hypothetical protein [Candidatus Woesearchaeota archaeon]
MKLIKICPKCGGIYIRYKRPIGNPFGPGKWVCYTCNYSGKFPSITRSEIAEFKSKIRDI